jgi:plastocyanin
MIWRWLICFSTTLWLTAGSPAPPPRSGEVAGTVELVNSNDPETRRNHNYSGAVLWLEPSPRPASLPMAPLRVTMEQKNKQFNPHVIAIPVGSTVDFPNNDVLQHNVFSLASGQQFDLSLYAGGQTRSVTFRYKGIARVYCNIHSTMSAIIAVLDTPWYAVTPASGKFVIPNVPPGEYVLHIFHERALPERLALVQPKITVPEDGLTVPLITISETGVVQPPHPDKHGQPYPVTPRYPTTGGGGN